MTREEAIQFLDNMKHEEAGRVIGKDGFYAELMGYHVQALNIAIKALEQEPKTGFIPKSVIEDIKAEIKEEADSSMGSIGDGYYDALDIIDKHIGGAKMEVSE